MFSGKPTYSPARIYSLGYGNRNPQQLFDLIKSHGCSYLIDVRSSPYSRFHKQYNREVLEQSCEEYGVTYLYMGDHLGGKPRPDELDALGRTDYQKMAAKPLFQEGLDRLVKARDSGISVALLCAEMRPETCHRTRLIGSALAERGVELLHIDEDARLCPQSDVVQRFNHGQEDLFSGL